MSEEAKVESERRAEVAKRDTFEWEKKLKFLGLFKKGLEELRQHFNDQCDILINKKRIAQHVIFRKHEAMCDAIAKKTLGDYDEIGASYDEYAIKLDEILKDKRAETAFAMSKEILISVVYDSQYVCCKKRSMVSKEENLLFIHMTFPENINKSKKVLTIWDYFDNSLYFEEVHTIDVTTDNNGVKSDRRCKACSSNKGKKMYQPQAISQTDLYCVLYSTRKDSNQETRTILIAKPLPVFLWLMVSNSEKYAGTGYKKTDKGFQIDIDLTLSEKICTKEVNDDEDLPYKLKAVIFHIGYYQNVTGELEQNSSHFTILFHWKGMWIYQSDEHIEFNVGYTKLMEIIKKQRGDEKLMLPISFLYSSEKNYKPANIFDTGQDSKSNPRDVAKYRIDAGMSNKDNFCFFNTLLITFAIIDEHGSLFKAQDSSSSSSLSKATSSTPTSAAKTSATKRIDSTELASSSSSSSSVSKANSSAPTPAAATPKATKISSKLTPAVSLSLELHKTIKTFLDNSNVSLKDSGRDATRDIEIVRRILINIDFKQSYINFYQLFGNDTRNRDTEAIYYSENLAFDKNNKPTPDQLDQLVSVGILTRIYSSKDIMVLMDWYSNLKASSSIKIFSDKSTIEELIKTQSSKPTLPSSSPSAVVDSSVQLVNNSLQLVNSTQSSSSSSDSSPRSSLDPSNATKSDSSPSLAMKSKIKAETLNCIKAFLRDEKENFQKQEVKESWPVIVERVINHIAELQAKQRCFMFFHDLASNKYGYSSKEWARDLTFDKIEQYKMKLKSFEFQTITIDKSLPNWIRQNISESTKSTSSLDNDRNNNMDDDDIENNTGTEACTTTVVIVETEEPTQALTRLLQIADPTNPNVIEESTLLAMFTACTALRSISANNTFRLGVCLLFMTYVTANHKRDDQGDSCWTSVLNDFDEKYKKELVKGLSRSEQDRLSKMWNTSIAFVASKVFESFKLVVKDDLEDALKETAPNIQNLPFDKAVAASLKVHVVALKHLRSETGDALLVRQLAVQQDRTANRLRNTSFGAIPDRSFGDGGKGEQSKATKPSTSKGSGGGTTTAVKRPATYHVAGGNRCLDKQTPQLKKKKEQEPKERSISRSQLQISMDLELDRSSIQYLNEISRRNLSAEQTTELILREFHIILQQIGMLTVERDEIKANIFVSMCFEPNDRILPFLSYACSQNLKAHYEVEGDIKESISSYIMKHISLELSITSNKSCVVDRIKGSFENSSCLETLWYLSMEPPPAHLDGVREILDDENERDAFFTFCRELQKNVQKTQSSIEQRLNYLPKKKRQTGIEWVDHYKTQAEALEASITAFEEYCTGSEPLISGIIAEPINFFDLSNIGIEKASTIWTCIQDETTGIYSFRVLYDRSNSSLFYDISPNDIMSPEMNQNFYFKDLKSINMEKPQAVLNLNSGRFDVLSSDLLNQNNMDSIFGVLIDNICSSINKIPVTSQIALMKHYLTSLEPLTKTKA